MTRTAAPRLLALALATALALAPVAHAQNFAPFRVADIRVDGLQRIASGTVFTYLTIERGDTVDSAKAASAIRALFKTGFFSDIELDRQGDILVVKVTERPAINKLTVKGNKEIKTDDLLKGLKQIGLAEGETFDRLSLDRVTQELNRQYDDRGRYNVAITPTVTVLDRNRVDVTINIVEGKTAKIRNINVVGNKVYTDKQLLDNWESGTSNWLSWYSHNDQYSREKLSGDLEKLNSYYLDRGYIDFNINSTQVAISPDRRDMFVTANIVEGDIYKVTSVDVSGDTIVPAADLRKLIIIKPGEVFSRRKLEATVDAMTLLLSNIGYAFAKINPAPNVDKEKHTVGIDFQVIPGPRVMVRRIVFKGNTRTADSVMRREMRQFEGTWFSQAAVDRSRVRLQRLGYFDSVDVDTPAVPGSPDQIDLVVTVKERNSGQFTFSLGYSQLAGLITSVGLNESNFLGSGNRLGVSISNSRFQKSISASYTNPYFTPSGVSVGYNLIYNKYNFANYNVAQYSSNALGAGVTFGVPITESDTVGISFGEKTQKIIPLFGMTPQVIIDYLNAVGHYTFKGWNAEVFWAKDTRNSFFAPTAGTFQRLDLFVNLPGSTQEYYKLSYSFERYWPLRPWLVLRTAADIGYGAGYGNAGKLGLPFFENFYTGGVTSIRGFRDNTVGPTATVTGSAYLQPLGGALKTTGSIETFFPKLLDTESARISTFVDFGNVFTKPSNFSFSSFRASYGVALQWRAPIGPVIISYAQPFRHEKGDQQEHLQFTFGTSF
ncbi:MAG: outer membrane protein assembly factor BamA [Proteobacteria bacterium]|nr:outer membrane protein assembly factor BamA [Pseudomonadota bacterium]MBS0461441.1 outer membrane protein assembly factor BamA [Pseudomonadota bacterium]MBS0465531.1 outer membrane protein assembly factor BamA [Pseudomonadota bacterium]